MKLTAYLAKLKFLEFHQLGGSVSYAASSTLSHTGSFLKDHLHEAQVQTRWNEPPLILGAQMGLHNFVEKILQVSPQSVAFLDTRGRSVLRVAIENGTRQVLHVISKMAQGDNPILPSWMFSDIDPETGNTILHFAAVRDNNDRRDEADGGSLLKSSLMPSEQVPGQKSQSDDRLKSSSTTPEPVQHKKSESDDTGSQKKQPDQSDGWDNKGDKDEKVHRAEDDSIQLQDELKWFEKVQSMIPIEMVYSRNKEEKTAREVFTETHRYMFNNCKTQLVDMGKMCSGILAADVFASSFSIPGDKDPNTGYPLYSGRLPLTIFSHAYTIGFSWATTSLVLFMLIVISPYKEQQFRRAIPAKYLMACLAFVIMLAAFLVSFTCNIFLQIYGGQKTEAKDIIPMLLELAIFPTVCFIVLLLRGSYFLPSFVRGIWT